MAQGFSYAQHAIERTDQGLRTCVVRALLAACFELPTLLKKRQHGVQQQLFGIPGNQARSEFG